MSAARLIRRADRILPQQRPRPTFRYREVAYRDSRHPGALYGRVVSVQLT